MTRFWNKRTVISLEGGSSLATLAKSIGNYGAAWSSCSRKLEQQQQGAIKLQQLEWKDDIVVEKQHQNKQARITEETAATAPNPESKRSAKGRGRAKTIPIKYSFGETKWYTGFLRKTVCA